MSTFGEMPAYEQAVIALGKDCRVGENGRIVAPKFPHLEIRGEIPGLTLGLKWIAGNTLLQVGLSRTMPLDLTTPGEIRAWLKKIEGEAAVMAAPFEAAAQERQAKFAWMRAENRDRAERRERRDAVLDDHNRWLQRYGD